MIKKLVYKVMGYSPHNFDTPYYWTPPRIRALFGELGHEQGEEMLSSAAGRQYNRLGVLQNRTKHAKTFLHLLSTLCLCAVLVFSLNAVFVEYFQQVMFGYIAGGTFLLGAISTIAHHHMTTLTHRLSELHTDFDGFFRSLRSTYHAVANGSTGWDTQVAPKKPEYLPNDLFQME